MEELNRFIENFRELEINKVPKFCEVIFFLEKAKNMNEVVRSKKDSGNLSNVENRLWKGGFAFAYALCASRHKPTRSIFNAF